MCFIWILAFKKASIYFIFQTTDVMSVSLKFWKMQKIIKIKMKDNPNPTIQRHPLLTPEAALFIQILCLYIYFYITVLLYIVLELLLTSYSLISIFYVINSLQSHDFKRWHNIFILWIYHYLLHHFSSLTLGLFSLFCYNCIRKYIYLPQPLLQTNIWI